jgi:hypothetical protein
MVTQVVAVDLVDHQLMRMVFTNNHMKALVAVELAESQLVVVETYLLTVV